MKRKPAKGLYPSRITIVQEVSPKMASQVVLKVRPREFKEFLLNPHKGCQTFQRFNGDPLGKLNKCHEEGPLSVPPRQFEGTTPGYLPSTVAYCRWFWEVLEPEDGRYDFTVVEQSLKTARERGQTLHVRLMPHGSPVQPPLPKWYIDNYPTRERMRRDKPFTAVIYDGAEYLDKWGSLITEFGRCFDSNPDLEAVDMSYIGPWGEGGGECSTEGVDCMTRIYTEAHPDHAGQPLIIPHRLKLGGMGSDLRPYDLLSKQRLDLFTKSAYDSKLRFRRFFVRLIVRHSASPKQLVSLLVHRLLWTHPEEVAFHIPGERP